MTKWIAHGYIYVQDLFIDDIYVSYEYVRNTIGDDGTLLFEYHAILNALPMNWRNPDTIQATDPVEPQFCGIQLNLITAGSIRRKLLENRSKMPNCVSFWRNKIPELQIDGHTFLTPFLASKEPRLRVLQWKIIHNIYPIKILLQKMSLADSSNCTFCNERDYIEHFFCSCRQITSLWNTINLILSSVTGNTEVLSQNQILFGVQPREYPNYLRNEINCMILVGKMCISKFKYGDHPNLIQLFNFEWSLRKWQWLNN